MNINEILDLFSYSKQIVVTSGNLKEAKESLSQIQSEIPKHAGSSFELKNKSYLQNAENFLVKKIDAFESGINSEKKRISDLEVRRAERAKVMEERKAQHSHAVEIQKAEEKAKAAKAAK